MAPAPEWKSLGELTSLGMAMVVATMLGLGAGYYLDHWLGTSPWLLLLGLGFGIAAGFVLLFRSVKSLDGRE
jgi:ATP synthase protein I